VCKSLTGVHLEKFPMVRRTLFRRRYTFKSWVSAANSQAGTNHSELLYDWRCTADQFVLATSPLRLTTSNFIFQLNTCGYSPYVTSSLTKGWIYRLQLLLVFSSAVILKSEFRVSLCRGKVSTELFPSNGYCTVSCVHSSASTCHRIKTNPYYATHSYG
jgi:hypothetical protein